MTDLAVKELKLTFDAVYYHVADMDRAVAFYRDVLGFRLTTRDYVARFNVDGVLFELVPSSPGHVSSGTGNARLSLGVHDINEATAALEAKGISTTAIKQEPGGLISFFRDPDGNELCLWQSTTPRGSREFRTICEADGTPMIEIVKSAEGNVALFEAGNMDNKLQFPASLTSQLIRALESLD